MRPSCGVVERGGRASIPAYRASVRRAARHAGLAAQGCGGPAGTRAATRPDALLPRLN